MSNYYKNDDIFNVQGYEIYFTRFADSIVNDHFKDAKQELEEILNNFYIHESQIIEGGGGKSSITQSLASVLDKFDWAKAIINSEHHVHGKVLTSESHEVDHYKSFDRGNIGLEIEWNNKDPFYDRDLENFRKLHQIGELSLGVLVTRSSSLQKELAFVFHRFLSKLYPFNIEKLLEHISLSDNAKKVIKILLDLPQEDALNRITTYLYSSKYGTATTHMNKLLLRINRGVGNPCPLILIGIGDERLINEGI